jgi:hypothetical protein
MSILVYWLFGGIRRAHPSHLADKAEKVRFVVEQKL